MQRNTLENSIAVPQKLKQRIITWLSDSTPRYVSKNGNICPHKTCKQMFIIFIMAKKWKTQVFINWVNKMCYTSKIEYYLVIKKWSTDTGYNMGKPLKHVVREQKQDTKEHIWFHYMKYSE